MSNFDKQIDRLAAIIEWNFITPISSKLTGSAKFDLLNKKFRPRLKMKFDGHIIRFWVNDDETIRYKSDKGYTGDLETFSKFVDLIRKMYSLDDFEDVKFVLKFLGLKCKFTIDSNYVITYRYVKGDSVYTGVFDKSFISFYRKMLEEME